MTRNYLTHNLSTMNKQSLSEKQRCICKEENAWYFDFGAYKCQYCSGFLTDIERVKKIIAYNTPVNMPNRDKHIMLELAKHERQFT